MEAQVAACRLKSFADAIVVPPTIQLLHRSIFYPATQQQLLSMLRNLDFEVHNDKADRDQGPDGILLFELDASSDPAPPN